MGNVKAETLVETLADTLRDALTLCTTGRCEIQSTRRHCVWHVYRTEDRDTWRHMDNMEAEKLVETLADTLIKAKNEPLCQPISDENAWALVDTGWHANRGGDRDTWRHTCRFGGRGTGRHSVWHASKSASWNTWQHIGIVETNPRVETLAGTPTEAEAKTFGHTVGDKDALPLVDTLTDTPTGSSFSAALKMHFGSATVKPSLNPIVTQNMPK